MPRILTPFPRTLLTGDHQVAGALFFMVIVLLFLAEGAINAIQVVALDGEMYKRSVYVVFLIATCALLRGFFVDRALTAYAALLVVAILSFGLNGRSASDLVEYIAPFVLGGAVYYAVKVHLDRDNVPRIIQTLYLIGYIQLPIVVLQFLSYDRLPAPLRNFVAPQDIGVGTFDLNADFSLAFFCIALVVFALFNDRAGTVLTYPRLAAAWLSLTVFVTNAEMQQFLLVIVWLFYGLRNLRPAQVASTILVISLSVFVANLALAGLLGDQSGFGDRFQRLVLSQLPTIFSSTGADSAALFQGLYARPAFINYYFTQHDIIWLGDGPGSFRERFAPMGHLYEQYIEVGLVGLALTYLTLYHMAKGLSGKLTREAMLLLGLLAFSTLTTPVFSSTAIILVFCIVVRGSMILRDQVAETPASGYTGEWDSNG